MPCLISTSGHLLEFRKFPSRFGTYTDNELVVQDGLGVLGHHFTLRREGVRIVIEATPKAVTAVNGNDVRRANIRDGDRIRVGELMLIYSNPSGQQNHLAGRLDAEKPIALPAPEARALPAPATLRHTLPPTSASPTSEQKTTSSARGAPQSPQIASPNESIPLQRIPAASQEPPPYARQGASTPKTPISSTSNTPTLPVSEGIPTESETTPSQSFMAWAKEAADAKVSPFAEQVSEAISAHETASPLSEVAVLTSNHTHTRIPASSPATPTPSTSTPETSSVTIPSFQAAPVNSLANSVVQSGGATHAGASPAQAPRETTQQPANPFAEAAKEDLAAVFFQPDEDAEDLADIFPQDETTHKQPAEPERVPSEDIPDIPKISEAEKVGAIAEASELPAKDINPIGSVLNKRKQPPAPPPPANPVESKAVEPTRKSSLLKEKKATKQKKKITDTMESRLTSTKLQPKYRLQIPWHKVVIFLCLVFAGAGAYLATSGQWQLASLTSTNICHC